MTTEEFTIRSITKNQSIDKKKYLTNWENIGTFIVSVTQHIRR